MSTLTIPFYGDNLLVIDHNNEPYAPMKTIVEGMGLDWSYQYRKLQGNAKRWGVAVIAIPTKSAVQDMICIPLRKLFGWLMTIQPSRVKPEIRKHVELYQDECDDVLFNHWTARNKAQVITNEKIISHLRGNGYLVAPATKGGLTTLLIDWIPAPLFYDLVDLVAWRVRSFGIKLK